MENRKSLFWLVVVLLVVLFKLYLVYDIPIIARAAGLHDDRLMVNLAENLLEGRWLGTYDQYTFIKGISYPSFLAISNLVHVPINVAHTLLFAISALSLVFSLGVVLKKSYQKIVLFSFVFFSPISYSLETFQLIYRDDIYYSLILFLVSCYIAVLLRIDNYAANKKWMIVASVVFIFVWFCREDSVWIVPMMLGVSFVIFYKSSQKAFVSKILAMPYISLLFTCFIFGSINWFIYGEFIINEMQYSSFTKAYNRLTMIRPEKELEKVKLSQYQLEKAYDVSPHMRLLKEEYSGEVGSGWKRISGGFPGNENVPAGEIAASHSMWAFRDMVSRLGYYKSTEAANDFYNKIIQELDMGFENGMLEKRSGVYIPLFSTINSGELYKLVSALRDTIFYVVKMDGVNMDINAMSIDSSDNGIEKFEKLTNQRAQVQNGIFFSGWCVSKSEDYRLILKNNEASIEKDIELQQSPDVAIFFKNNNIDVVGGEASRFQIQENSSNLNEYIINVIGENNHSLGEINPYRKGIVETDNLIFCIDNVNIYESSHYSEIKKYILEFIAGIYRQLYIYGSLLSVPFILFCIMVRKKCSLFCSNILYAIEVLLLVFLLRVFVIAYNSVTAFYSINYKYLSPCYPIISSIIVIVILYLLNEFICYKIKR